MHGLYLAASPFVSQHVHIPVDVGAGAVLATGFGVFEATHDPVANDVTITVTQCQEPQSAIDWRPGIDTSARHLRLLL